MRGVKHKLGYTLASLYKSVGISGQAVSQYRKREQQQNLDTLLLLNEIDQYRSRHPGCGLRKMFYQLKVKGMGRDKFIEFGKHFGYQLSAVKSYTRTTFRGYYNWPNLISGMLVMDVNRVWQSDITYFRVHDFFYYLTFIIDVYSRKIVGHAISNTLQARATIEALKKALRSRGLDNHKGLIIHSDRGTQYTSNQYMELLLRNGITPSMGEKGQDNAYAERLNGVIKNEYLTYRKIASYKQLAKWTNQAVKQYNEERIHAGLRGKQSPDMFEKQLLTLNYQKRPKVIIYADGKTAMRRAKYTLHSLPEKALQAHICPI